MKECLPEELDFEAWLRPGDTIAIGQLSAEPQALVQALCRVSLPTGVRIFIGAHLSGLLENLPSVPVISFGAMFRNAKLGRQGRLSVYPVAYSRMDSAIRAGIFQADVVLIQVARDAETGALYWSAANDYMETACRRARLVVAECNAQAPVVFGAQIPASVRIDYLVHTDTCLPIVSLPQPTVVDEAIAAHVAAEVDDGATLQTGIGSLPDTVYGMLSSHRNLGVHAGAIGDAVRELMDKGVINNACKSRDAGSTVTGALIGSTTLYRWAHRHPGLRMLPANYTHRFDVLAGLHRPVAVNAALQVDLFGQVNSEHAGPRYIGGLGGLGDFVRGIQAAPQGKSIICLRSTFSSSADDEPGRSTIVPSINGLVTLSAADADIVITEWGVARLRGLSLYERPAALIAIAHPAHRNWLQECAQKLLPRF